MDAASSTPTGTFDPFTQTMAWLTTYGPTTKPIEVTMEDLSFFWYQNMHLGLVYGSQLGLTTLMLVTLLLVTQPGKRRAPIYVLNVTALVLDLTRSTLMAVWLVSMWNHPVTIFARDYSRITRGDVANSVVVNVVKTLELGTVLCSLVFQIRVIMSTATSMQRASVLSAAFIIATATMCVQLASAVVNSRNIALFIPPEELGLQLRLADLARIMQVVNTGFLLLVFAARLGFAIKQRHKLGHSQFGPMQMVFIGSMQSMLIPGMSSFS